MSERAWGFESPLPHRCGGAHPRTAQRRGPPGGGLDGRMALTFELDPPVTDELRTALLALWVEVTNAGGAVGFVAPTTADAVRPTAEAALHGVLDGPDHLLVGTEGGRLMALLFVTDNRF